MKVLHVIRTAERWTLVFVFLTMVTLFFTGVVTREIGGTLASRFAWVEEAVRLLNLFLVFLALGLALERGKHVGIPTLRNLMPARMRWLILKLTDTAGLIFSLYLAWLGISLVQFVLRTNQVSPTLGIPTGLIYLAPVIGFSLLGLRYALSLFGALDRIDGDQVEREDD